MGYVGLASSMFHKKTSEAGDEWEDNCSAMRGEVVCKAIESCFSKRHLSKCKNFRFNPNEKRQKSDMTWITFHNGHSVCCVEIRLW